MRTNYFLIASIAMLLLSLIAFSDNLITDIGQESNRDPKFIIHGLFLFAWFIILVIQTGFIRRENYDAHMRLGIAGLVVAVGVVLSTFYVFAALYDGWAAMPFFVKANRIFMPSFALFVFLAYLNRRNAPKHKRFLYVGTLYMLLPILDRASGAFTSEHELFILIVWNAFFVSLFVYDWLTLKKIHRISWMGFVWFYLVWVISIFT